MRQELSDSIETDLISDTERQRLRSYTAKKATLLIVGQTNSGKSSFVNELLGGSFVPTSEVPCTSRIVRLKYSEENYYQVSYDSRPSEGIKTPFNKKKLPKEAIELEESKRDDPTWVNAVVEVGLNNPLLQSGHLEVIDAPGISENESLDKIVDECTHGILQVVVYVIDGNSSLRLQERGFLLKLKEKVGNLPIFYVCNKVDEDQRAQEFDQDSESDDNEETKPRSAEEKISCAYQALAKYHMVPADVPFVECPFFHGLSSKGVRNARLKKETNRFTEQFDALKFKLLKFAANGVSAHLKYGSELLCQIQDRVFDLFLSCNFKEGKISPQDDFFDHLEMKELEYYANMTRYVARNESHFAYMIDQAIKSNMKMIETEMGQMQFDSIKIGDVVGRNEVVEQCRRQIKDIVLFKVMEISMAKVKNTITQMSDNMRKSLETAFSEVVKKDDRLANVVTKQLEYSFLQHFQERNVCHHFDYGLMKFTVKVMDKAMRTVSNVWLAIRGKGTYVNEAWKREVAQAVLKGIDSQAIAERIRLNLQADLDNGHQLFVCNLAFMKRFCNIAAKQTDNQRRFAAEKAPYFSKLMSKARAVDNTLTLEVPSRVVVGKCLGRVGHRGSVFQVPNSSQVAKQLHATCVDESLEDQHFLAITRTFERIQNDAKGVLAPVSVKLDKNNKVTVLYPKMSSDLFDRFTGHPDNLILLRDGLRIVQQMIEALESCWDRGLHHIDLRLTNVMVDYREIAKLNVAKPRNDSIPYPDEKAPFHVPGRIPDEREMEAAEVASTLKCHCVYSLAVLLFLVLEQKYTRPGYAETDNVSQVYRAIAQAKDCEFIKSSKNVKESSAKRQVLEIVASTFNAQRQDEVRLTWLDHFKTSVERSFSSQATAYESAV